MLDTIEVVLGGNTYQVRPKFAAIMAIEKKLDRGITKILDDCTKDQTLLGLTDVAVILHQALLAEGVRTTLEKVGDHIIEGGGLHKFLTVTLEYLVNAITAGPAEVIGEPDSNSKS